MGIKDWLGLVSVLIAVAGFIPYLVDILRHKTRPHAYSWLVWTVLSAVGFGIQVQHDGGAGSWLLGISVLGTFAIFVLSLIYGHRDIHMADTISLFVALGAFILWAFSDKPVVAAVLITLVEAIGAYFPTFRKSYSAPYEETPWAYLAYAGSIALSLLALESYVLANIFYPAGELVLNLALVAFLMIRRVQVPPPASAASQKPSAQ